MIQLKRAYDAVESEDGCRILVDRLWPRGISREDLNIDHWFKEIAPSAELRKWFDHDVEKFEEFRLQYRDELAAKSDQLDNLADICQKHGTVTLVFSARDRKHNNAVVLKEFLKK